MVYKILAAGGKHASCPHKMLIKACYTADMRDGKYQACKWSVENAAVEPSPELVNIIMKCVAADTLSSPMHQVRSVLATNANSCELVWVRQACTVFI